ncbi:MAG TPA: cytidine deaminase [Terriglobia bacterium]|nr:cytidine deaminase [Terriglobia bacterium]
MKKVNRRTALGALGAAGVALMGDPLIPFETNSRDPRRRALAKFSARTRQGLLRLLNQTDFEGRIPAASARSLGQAEGKTAEELMIALLPLARTYARPPVSNYQVGAVVRGASGSLYLGANLEIPGQALGFSVHAEQSALSNAYGHDEKGVTSIAVTAAPCGHCRQFMNELSPRGEIQVWAGGRPPQSLSSLLPLAFGPEDLGLEHGAFPVIETNLAAPRGGTDRLTLAALEAARKSWAPYTKAQSGVALVTKQGRIHRGSYIENAAFNPSLPPLEAALAALILAGGEPAEVSRAVLVERQNALISQQGISEIVLRAVAPAARLEVVTVLTKA